MLGRWDVRATPTEIQVTESTRTTQRGGQVPDVQSVNPRYKGAKMSDMARALMRPQDPKVREILERREADEPKPQRS